MSESYFEGWPEDTKEAAQLVIDKYGEPHETCESQLIWHNVGIWKRIVATKEAHQHDFPAPHLDSVEGFINYQVPSDKVSDLYMFDGSVNINRTRGELSARCHDEEANNLALNLARDIIENERSVKEARDYYALEFLAARSKDATPYMDALTLIPTVNSADPDERIISDEALEDAVEEGKERQETFA